MTPAIVADALVSLAALVGVVALALRLGRRGGPMARRFRFALEVVGALLLARTLFWWSDLLLFSRLSVVAAGMVPLGAVLVTEGFLRRHAPLALKAWVALGAAGFAVAAFTPVPLLDGAVTLALFVFQLVALAAVAAWVVLRRRAALSPAQNRAVDRVGLALLVIVPLLVTDYRGIVDLPVRLGGVGILALVWFAVTADRPGGTRTFAAVALAALVATGALALMTPLGLADLVRAAAVIFCLGLVAALLLAVGGAGSARRGGDVLHALLDARTGSVERFLADLEAHPAVRGARLLREHDLADLDMARLQSAFDARPVWGREEGDEQVAFLLDIHEATHVLRARRDPPLLATLQLSEMTAGGREERELRLVQKMAELVGRSEGAAARGSGRGEGEGGVGGGRV